MTPHMCNCRQDIKLDIYDWREAEGQLETKWRVSGIVQLPWRPLLAAAGGTTHVFSQVQASSRLTAYLLVQFKDVVKYQYAYMTAALSHTTLCYTPESAGMFTKRWLLFYYVCALPAV